MINDLGEGILGGQRPVFEFSGKKNYIFLGEKKWLPSRRRDYSI